MNILHLTGGTLDSGAGKGALGLHLALLKQGVDSHLLCNGVLDQAYQQADTTQQTDWDKVKYFLQLKLDGWMKLPYRHQRDRVFDTNFFGGNILKTHQYQAADIIHLHRINHSFLKISQLAKIDKPIVWTLRDMWPMTGGCHYALDCERFKSGCGSCPVLNSQRQQDLSRLVFRLKKKHFPHHIQLVGISSWISQQARASKLFNSFSVKTIANNVSTDLFQPISKPTARQILGLDDTGKKIILVGAQYLQNPYKGFEHFLKSLQFLEQDQYLLLFFGRLSDPRPLQQSGFEFRSLGFLHDAASLRLAYSSADVFAAPSIMEAFGKTLAEAMSCQTPVVCFDAAGPKDIVDHKQNGYKAEAFDSKDLAAGVDWVVRQTAKSRALNKAARDKVVRCFDDQVVAQKYQKLYQQLLTRK